MGSFTRAAGIMEMSLGIIVMAAVGCAGGSQPVPNESRITDPPTVTASVEQQRVAANAGAINANDLRVMSFNCRVSTLFDLTNTWGLRKGLLAETIQNFNPDLLGTQECLASQSDYLRERLPGYDFVGVGRNDGKRRGEMCGVFFRADRFERLDSGHFWLSEQPTKAGSKGWGAVFPRMVTWVKLRPRDGATPAFCWFNTHLDAFSSKARLNGAKLLRERMALIAGAMPVLVTGDFNADEGSDPYLTLVSNRTGMADTFRAANLEPLGKEGTRHGFLGMRGGPRIDWILASGDFRTMDAGIDRTRGGLGYPSDHFPVTAVLRPNDRVMAQAE